MSSILETEEISIRNGGNDMSDFAMEAARLVEMLPEAEQSFAVAVIEKLVMAG